MDIFYKILPFYGGIYGGKAFFRQKFMGGKFMGGTRFHEICINLWGENLWGERLLTLFYGGILWDLAK